MGIPFENTGGFPNCPPARSQIGNSIFKTSVITVENCGPDRPIRKYYLDIFSLVIICLNPQECIWLISQKTNVIEIMCKLSFKLHLSKPSTYLICECKLSLRIFIWFH